MAGMMGWKPNLNGSNENIVCVQPEQAAEFDGGDDFPG
jgi:hypothetical protein